MIVGRSLRGRVSATQRGTKPSAVPLWLVLQTHRKAWGPVATTLREPSVEEVRLQNWIALGEGARGIWWFIYSSQQGWVGLRDQPVLYAEVGDLAQRTTALPRLSKQVDQIFAGPDYASTMTDSNGVAIRRRRQHVMHCARCDAHECVIRSPPRRRVGRDVCIQGCRSHFAVATVESSKWFPKSASSLIAPPTPCNPRNLHRGDLNDRLSQRGRPDRNGQQESWCTEGPFAADGRAQG